jgi:hypothetical protein
MRVLEVCEIVLIVGAPWIAGIAYYWRRLPPGDRTDQPSFGELLRQRMNVR